MNADKKTEDLFIEGMNELYDKLVDSEEGRSLIKTLTKMQMEKYDKLEEAQAVKNAKACIALCQMWDNINDCPTEQSKEIFSGFVNKLDKESKRNFLINIEEILKTTEKTNAQDDESGLLVNREADERTTEEIEKSVLKAIDNMVISEAFFENAGKNVDGVDGFCEEFEKMNSFDIGMKSIFSMGLYLEDEDITLKEAVESACMSMDIYEVCDSVSKGLISREKALRCIKKIVKGALIFAAVCAVIFLIVSALEAILPALATTAATTTATTATASTTASVLAANVPAVFAEIAGVSAAGSTATAAASAGGSVVAGGLGTGALLSISTLPDTNLLKQVIESRGAISGGVNVLQSALQGGEAAIGASGVLAAAGTAESANMMMKAKGFFGRSALNVSSIAVTLEKNSNKIARFLGRFAAKQNRKHSIKNSEVLEEIKDVYESQAVVFPNEENPVISDVDECEIDKETFYEEENI